MALKAAVESLDGLDEAIHGLYKQEGDRFVLQVEGAEELPAIKNLKNAYERQKVATREAKEKLAAFDGLDVDQLKAIHDEFDGLSIEEVRAIREKAATGGKPDPEEMDRIRKQAAAQEAKAWEKKLKEVQDQLGNVSGKYQKRVMHGDLEEAMAEVGVLPADRKYVRRYFEALNPSIRDDDESGMETLMFESAVGPQSAKEFVAAWAQTDEAAKFLTPTGKGGSGAGDGQPSPAGARGSINRNDPTAWAGNLEGIAKGEVLVRG